MSKMVGQKTMVEQPCVVSPTDVELNSKGAFIECLEKTLEYAEEEDFIHCLNRAIEVMSV